MSIRMRPWALARCPGHVSAYRYVSIGIFVAPCSRCRFPRCSSRGIRQTVRWYYYCRKESCLSFRHNDKRARTRTFSSRSGLHDNLQWVSIKFKVQLQMCVIWRTANYMDWYNNDTIRQYVTQKEKKKWICNIFSLYDNHVFSLHQLICLIVP